MDAVQRAMAEAEDAGSRKRKLDSGGGGAAAASGGDNGALATGSERMQRECDFY